MPFGCGLGWAKQPCRSQWFSGRGSQNNGVDDTQCAANDLVLTTAAVTRGSATMSTRHEGSSGTVDIRSVVHRTLRDITRRKCNVVVSGW